MERKLAVVALTAIMIFVICPSNAGGPSSGKKKKATGETSDPGPTLLASPDPMAMERKSQDNTAEKEELEVMYDDEDEPYVQRRMLKGGKMPPIKFSNCRCPCRKNRVAPEPHDQAPLLPKPTPGGAAAGGGAGGGGAAGGGAGGGGAGGGGAAGGGAGGGGAAGGSGTPAGGLPGGRTPPAPTHAGGGGGSSYAADMSSVPLTSCIVPVVLTLKIFLGMFQESGRKQQPRKYGLTKDQVSNFRNQFIDGLKRKGYEDDFDFECFLETLAGATEKNDLRQLYTRIKNDNGIVPLETLMRFFSCKSADELRELMKYATKRKANINDEELSEYQQLTQWLDQSMEAETKKNH